jgi:hypothetical protein
MDDRAAEFTQELAILGVLGSREVDVDRGAVDMGQFALANGGTDFPRDCVDHGGTRLLVFAEFLFEVSDLIQFGEPLDLRLGIAGVACCFNRKTWGASRSGAFSLPLIWQ